MIWEDDLDDLSFEELKEYVWHLEKKLYPMCQIDEWEHGANCHELPSIFEGVSDTFEDFDAVFQQEEGE